MPKLKDLVIGAFFIWMGLTVMELQAQAARANTQGCSDNSANQTQAEAISATETPRESNSSF